jgi:hypothetical protein
MAPRTSGDLSQAKVRADSDDITPERARAIRKRESEDEVR